MENILIILISSFIFLFIILLLGFKQELNKYKKEILEKELKIEDLELNITELYSELKKTNIELHDAHRIINSNEYVSLVYERVVLKTVMSKFSYENEKNLLLNKFMKDCISDFIIWNESPDKQNMIGELFVYVKKE